MSKMPAILLLVLVMSAPVMAQEQTPIVYACYGIGHVDRPRSLGGGFNGSGVQLGYVHPFKDHWCWSVMAEGFSGYKRGPSFYGEEEYGLNCASIRFGLGYSIISNKRHQLSGEFSLGPGYTEPSYIIAMAHGMSTTILARAKANGPLR